MINIKAIKRESKSSGFTNKLRQKGFIPAILYGGKTPNQSISIEKKSGARALRSVMEDYLMDVMYKLPDMEGVERVVITGETIKNRREPEFETIKNRKSA